MTEQVVNAYVTMYGFPDNDPPNSAAIAHPVIHQRADGVGTFDDPITLAGDPSDIPFGTKIYVPYLQKYFIMEDTCAAAMKSSTDPLHIDLWAGGDRSTNVKALHAIENANTRDSAQIIINPDATHPVNLTAFAPTRGTVGTSGDDVLFGSSRKDELHGASGNDNLTGGKGADKFFFDTSLDPSTNVDTITDFKPWKGDKIVLSESDFPMLGSIGKLDASHFHVGPAETADPQIVYAPEDGSLSYDSNGNAPGGLTQFATLTTHPALDNKDFIVEA